MHETYYKRIQICVAGENILYVKQNESQRHKKVLPSSLVICLPLRSPQVVSSLVVNRAALIGRDSRKLPTGPGKLMKYPAAIDAIRTFFLAGGWVDSRKQWENIRIYFWSNAHKNADWKSEEVHLRNRIILPMISASSCRSGVGVAEEENEGERLALTRLH